MWNKINKTQTLKHRVYMCRYIISRVLVDFQFELRAHWASDGFTNYSMIVFAFNILSTEDYTNAVQIEYKCALNMYKWRWHFIYCIFECNEITTTIANTQMTLYLLKVYFNPNNVLCANGFCQTGENRNLWNIIRTMRSYRKHLL